ncbi:MAG: B12-binding domain-containing radical SAM protein [Planctomycetota bacterium]
MKVLLVYPPDRTLPTIPFSSLAVLQGCLRSRGHTTVVRDLNVEVFHHLVKRPTLNHYANLVQGWFQELDAKPELTPAEFDRYRFLAPLAAIPHAVLDRAEDSLKVMRDPARFYQHQTFNRAFDDLAAMIRFLYAASPIYDVEAEDFVTRNLETLKSFGGDPVHEAYGTLLDSVVAEQPDAVCITMPFSFQFFEGLRFAHLFKQRLPNVPIVIGGCTINDYKNTLFKDPGLFDVIDYAQPGEGEDAVCELMEALQGQRPIEQVSNLVWRDETGTIRFSTMPPSYPDLDAIAPPDFSGIPFEGYLVPEGIANLQTSRGCYYGKCTFCGDSFRRNFRMRKPSLVYQDIKGIHEQTGVKYFLFWDSLAPPKTLKTVAEGIERDRLPVSWFAETKFEKPYVSAELVAQLQRGGGRFLQFGFESGSQRVLDLIDKGNDLQRVDQILENMHAVGLKAGVSWFIGFPGETPEEALQTYDFVHRRRDRIAISVYAGTFMLGADTLVFADPGRYGIEVVRSESGGWDYRHKDGHQRYDRTPFDEAFRARSDLPLLCHGAYLLYATNKVEDLEKITGLGRFGPVSREMIERNDVVLRLCDSVLHLRFGYDAFEPRPATAGPIRRSEIDVAYLLKNGASYRMDADDRTLCGLVDGHRALGEVLRASGLQAEHGRKRLARLIDRGIVLAPRDSAEAPPAAARATGVSSAA